MYSEDENDRAVLGGVQMGFLLSGLTWHLLQQHSVAVRTNAEAPDLKAPVVPTASLPESSAQRTVARAALALTTCGPV